MSRISPVAFEIVDSLSASESISDVLRDMWAAGRIFGYDAFLVANLPVDETASAETCALLPSWP